MTKEEIYKKHSKDLFTFEWLSGQRYQFNLELGDKKIVFNGEGDWELGFELKTDLYDLVELAEDYTLEIV